MKKKLLSFVLAIFMSLGTAAALPENGQTETLRASAQEQTEVLLPSGGVEYVQVEELDDGEIIIPRVCFEQQLNGTVADPALPFAKTSSAYINKCLSNYKHGSGMQKLYDDIIDKLEAVWYSQGDWKQYKLDYNEELVYGFEVNFSDLGLTKNEAFSVYMFSCITLPVKFFTTLKVFLSSTAGSLYIGLFQEYAPDTVRTEYTNKILSYIKSYESCLSGKKTLYEKALALHDELCKRTEYAYVPGTKTPESELWAHTITGAIDKNSAVCQGYALVYEMLVNYYGGDCSYCPGNTPSGSHAWNIVRLDDGRYYYVDSTWDDSFHKDGDEVIHTNFAVGTEKFYIKHTREQGYDKREIDDTLYYQYYLPDIPKSDFDPSSKPHTHSYKTTVVEPTCTDEGYELHKCSGCKDEYRDNFKPAAHKWKDPEWIWSKDNKSATAKFVCANDKSHTMTLTATVSIEKTPATCEKKGKIEYVAAVRPDGKLYSTSKSELLDKLGHNYKDTVVKPTCKAQGYTLHKCSRCGDTYKDTYTKATGHKFSAWKTTGYNFSKNTSAQTRKCTACGKTENQTTKNAITRLAGANRYESAAVISKEMYNTSDTVIIATGLTFNDALVAVPLASAYDAPLLLATEKHITAQTEAELKRLGAKSVIVVSTNGAIGANAKAEIKALNLKATYIEGKTCFETAAKVAKALQTKTKKAPTTIFFATDSAFADALSASPVAAIKNAPIMYLKNTGSIDKATADYLKSVKDKVKNAYIIGGDGVISDVMMKNVATALGLTVNKTVVRVAGKNRYETCTAVNNKFKSVLTGDGICVAKGLDFPDALAGGVYAAATRQALFLADGKKLQDCQNTYLKGKNASKITVFGGTGAVDDELVKLITTASV